MSEEYHGVSKGTPRATKGWRDPLIERAAKFLEESAPSGTSSDDSRQRSGEAMAKPHREEGADNRRQTKSRTPEHIDHPAMAGEARSSGKNDHADTGRSDKAEAPQKLSSAHVSIDRARARKARIIIPGSIGSRTGEEFRQIKQSVLYSMFYGKGKSSRNANLLMVTSAGPDEGKTFISTNLAMSISSEKDLNVLLVDIDSTNQGVTKSLGIPWKKGLFDLIDDPSLDFTDVILRTDLEGFSVIPAGKPHPLGVELLGSERLIGLVDDLALRYRDRIVIFDAPPVLATTASAVLAQHMGQIVFVVEASKTSRSTIEEALNLVSHCQNIAFVLNKTRSVLGDTYFGAYYQSYDYGKQA